MNISIDTKTLLFVLANLGALALAWTGKIDWAHAKEILVWSLGPYLIGQSYENAQRSAREATKEIMKEALDTVKKSMTATSKEEVSAAAIAVTVEKKEEPPKS